MNFHRHPLRLLLLPAVALSASLAHAQLAGTVAVPNLRQQALDRAQALLTAKPAPIPEEQVNPFNPAAFNEALTGTTTVASQGGENTGGTATGGTATGGKSTGGPRTDRELLVALANALRPGGSIVLGDNRILLLREKKVKVGEKLTLTFEGAQYVVEVTAINPTHFTLRYNSEEYTRPIKQGSAP